MTTLAFVVYSHKSGSPLARIFFREGKRENRCKNGIEFFPYLWKQGNQK
jgi:hypothetical protein